MEVLKAERFWLVQYVLRMLGVRFQIPNHVAIKISLELKKLLIDNSLLDVSGSDLDPCAILPVIFCYLCFHFTGDSLL